MFQIDAFTKGGEKNENQNAQVCRGSAVGLDADVAFLLLIGQPINVSQRRPV